jgi:hypothetical protein
MNHRWSDSKTTIAHDSPDGCERHVRTCQACGIIKTTIGQPDGRWYVEYQMPGGAVWAARPDCAGAEPVKLREASCAAAIEKPKPAKQQELEI